jgi:hypothetical protein
MKGGRRLGCLGVRLAGAHPSQRRRRASTDDDALGHAIFAPPKLGGPAVINIRYTSSPLGACSVPALASRNTRRIRTRRQRKMTLTGSPSMMTVRSLLRQHLDRVQRRSRRHQIQTDAGPDTVSGFLTTSPNVIVEPIHPKARDRSPDDRRKVRRLDARSLGRSKSAAMLVTGHRLDDCREVQTRKTAGSMRH